MNNKVATFANKLLRHACTKNASDIHFHPFPKEDNVQIYFRIIGNRERIQTIPLSLYQLVLTYFKFSSSMDIGEKRLPQNGTLAFKSSDHQAFSLRLSTLPLDAIESLTIRIFPQQEVPTLDRLFLFPSQFKKMKSWLKNRAGLILLTGPTGCGKTTTMYALLQSMVNEKSSQAITIEDPVERKLENVIQVEVNEKAGITYHSGLKAALRHDPDILLVGEIRDEETARFAFRASLTGHLVLSTLHAKDAQGTIDRLVDLGINRVELHQTLIAVASIELLPLNMSGHCPRRAAIVELLDGRRLERIIDGEQIHANSFHSFNHLRKKAFAYGFIDDETFYR